jgi:hypothetical protein
MRLRHGKGSAPAWTAGCLGPFLACISLFAAATILLRGSITFGDGVALVFILILAATGVWLTIDYFRGK